MKTAYKFLMVLVSLILVFTITVIIYFRTTTPEGFAVLKNYCFGDGSDLVLESNYLPNSPLIKAELKKMKTGQDKVIRFHQYEDWKLSYALNPFHLVKTKNGFEIYQYIKFENKGG